MNEMIDPSAAKRLSRLKISINDELMRLKTIWCRTAYSPKADKIFKVNSHSFYEFHYVIAGSSSHELRVWIDGMGQHDLSVGDFIFIPRRTEHYAAFLSENCEKFVCGFELTSEQEQITDSIAHLCEKGTLHANETIAKLTDLILKETLKNMPTMELYVSRLFECMIIEMMRMAAPDLWKTDEAPRAAQFETDVRINDIHSYIEKNITHGIAAADVAKHMNISLRHLNRIVNEYENCTVGKLIDRYMTEAIKSQLRNPDMTLKSISENLGFSSEYAMNRFFKRIEGMTLGVFRSSIEK